MTTVRIVADWFRTLPLVLLSLLAVSSMAQLRGSTEASSIRQINFREFSYRVGSPYCGYFGDAVRVHNGKFANGEASFEVSRILYDDLTRDGLQEAVVVADCTPSQAANPGATVSFAYVYTLRNRQPVLLATFAYGSPWDFTGLAQEPQREDGLTLFDVTGIKVSSGALSFEHFAGQARCCPTAIVKRTFRWNGRRFVQVKETKIPWK